MKITVSRQELQAALLFASSDEQRFVLNGIQVESFPNKLPVLVATDGRRLAVIETVATQDADSAEEHRFILRSDFVKPLCALSKAIGGKIAPWICFDTKPGSKRVLITLVGKPVVIDVEDGAFIEGKYPLWRSIIPDKTQERAPISELGVNAEFMGDFAKAAKILESETPLVQMNLVGKDGQIEVSLYNLTNFYALIMPCRINEELEYQPEFLAMEKAFPKAEPEKAPDEQKEPK